MAQKIGFILHPGERPTIESVLGKAHSLGYETWIGEDDAEAALEQNAAGTALLVTVGGDGTFLFGARMAAQRAIPVLGVNRGRLGFLTDLDIDSLPGALQAFSSGEFRKQKRSMLKIEIDGHHGDRSWIALNDLAVKAQGISTVRIRVDVDDEVFGEFDADGVLIATTTGSTGYALSAGGPPIDPRVRAVMLVPLAPHAVITRPVVFPDTSVIRVRLEHGAAYAAADGQSQVELSSGAVATVTSGPELEIVHFPSSLSFVRRLHEKMHFGTPLRIRPEEREG